MCGIAGQIAFSGEAPSESMLREMGRRLAHRGRDHQGVLVSAPVGLVHQRLSILGTGPQGNQPKISDDGGIALVFNGEIVNYIELRNELEKKHAHCRTDGDTEVLLQGYAAEGIDFFKKLRGFYAFVIIDWRQRCYILHRDPCGIKPLYVHQGSQALSFASEVKALFADPRIKPRVSATGLQDYLTMQSYLPGNTLFSGVEALLPGHVLKGDIDGGRRATLVRQWHMPQEDERWELSYEDTVADLRQRLVETTALWSRSDVAIGSYISGGIDSSMIAALAASHVNPAFQNKLHTFSSIFDSDWIKDERQFSDIVAASIGSEHSRIFLNQESMIADHGDIIYALDMPVAGYSAPYRTMARTVRQHVRVVMTGHGGDELAAGYPKYIALQLAHDLGEALKGKPVFARAEHMPYLAQFEGQARQILAKAAFGDEKSLFSSMLDRSSYLLNQVTPELQMTGRDVVEEALQLIGEGSMLRKLLRLDFHTLLPALLHVEDRTSMVENLESRPPLLDVDIVEYFARVPTDFLLKNGLKSLLRDAARGLVPDMVIDNPRKSGVMYPIMQLFNGVMNEQVQADIASLDETGLFVIPAERLLTREQGINQRDTWALWSLARWFKHFNPEISG
ncbi:asparagine synthase (glutamine-hydrolyzing) [Delftia acidovorans]|uniref:asparagine synthase (glutamine-hydrolyzing) n=2 Tax=Delftia lacustris TaxID=558537 RepID=A0A7T2YRF5_9BURK|nr:asparagine synthase (glutamine-hydrolyzing) [Delftia acidovorans]EPD46117.1 asparagine synthase (glutamine-hydrolyzing) [Delftia acidovorans CCUG 15835]QPS80716.1 asparagine synthase (glutamine-hydrolyzing) [Delftia lacustris]